MPRNGPPVRFRPTWCHCCDDRRSRPGQGRRRARVRVAGRAVPARASAALLPATRLRAGRRGSRPGNTARRLARAQRLRGAGVAALLALPDRNQPEPQRNSRTRAPPNHGEHHETVKNPRRRRAQLARAIRGLRASGSRSRTRGTLRAARSYPALVHRRAAAAAREAARSARAARRARLPHRRSRLDPRDDAAVGQSRAPTRTRNARLVHRRTPAGTASRLADRTEPSRHLQRRRRSRRHGAPPDSAELRRSCDHAAAAARAYRTRSDRCVPRRPRRGSRGPATAAPDPRQRPAGLRLLPALAASGHDGAHLERQQGRRDHLLRRPRAARPLRSSRTHLADKDGLDMPSSVSRMARHTSSWETRSLYTERLCLRAPTPHDAEALYDLFADEEVMEGLGREPVSAVEDVRAMIEGMIRGWRSEGLGPFILETAAADRQVVGQAGLMIFDTRGWTPSTWAEAGSHAQPELGWSLIRSHWGHGYATEAAAAIKSWAYEFRAIDRLVSLISPDNMRSQHVAERLGATRGEAVMPADSGRQTVVWKHRRPPLRLDVIG